MRDQLNPLHITHEAIEQALTDTFLIGVVTGTSSNRVIVQLTRQGGTQTITMAKNAAYGSPENGDIVRVLSLPNGAGGRTYEVMYRIIK